MIPPLKAGASPLDRLRQGIARMVEHHGFQPVLPEDTDAFSPSGLVALLLTDDPQRNPEILDACVILPEALRPFADTVSPWVADAAASVPLMARYGVSRAPAVVFLRDGAYLGSLNGIRDWAEYQAEVDRLLHGPAQPRPIAITVVAATNGACA
ncbi:hypothetical protein [Zoogloea sp.]|uniref:hypothetical protein n=1 Tax=Zoogloea sp. TaxID=49181 RepID=UPI002CFD42DC|nr:hypothetical protein [Zoogloea sp.]